MSLKKVNNQLTPKEIVAELDKYIIGQDKAKKSVAIALRNRYRRKMVADEMKEEIIPKNILMIGPTGVGKTEIARRLSNLARAPFVKVEASKFTEVGYVGRSVESMIRDLTHNAINLLKSERMEEVQEQAEEMAKERILDHLLPAGSEQEDLEQKDEQFRETREKFRRMLEDGKLEDRVIEIEVKKSSGPSMQIFGSSGMDMEKMGMNIKEMLGNAFPDKKKTRKVTVSEARKIFKEKEATLVEINPLIITKDEEIIAADAKIMIDPAASYLKADTSPRYIPLKGDIGILANGAGLTMTTMDVVKELGGDPANFLEVGGEFYKKADEALNFLLDQKNELKGLIVNLFGAYARTDIITEQLIKVINDRDIKIPISFRIRGTGEKRARKMIKDELNQEVFLNLEDAVFDLLEST